jgi:hypothetical protein
VAPSRPQVTGFGATDAAWNASHTADSEFAPGAVYNVDPSLPGSTRTPARSTPQVMHQDGHVLGYDCHFPLALAGTASGRACATASGTRSARSWRPRGGAERRVAAVCGRGVPWQIKSRTR